MKIASWNVNGLRACARTGCFSAGVADLASDVLCLQEVKLSTVDQYAEPIPYPHRYWNLAVRKGYSGTAVFSKTEPLRVRYGMGIEEHDQEGRVITLDFQNYTLVNVYTPNAQHELLRLDYRMTWEDTFRAYLCTLDQEKPLVICGDFNVAHEEIDIARPGPNRGNPGFTDQERAKFSELLAAGFSDTYRTLYPDQRDAYTWWSYMGTARARNVGWRIDYFVVSERLMPRVQGATIYPEIQGSDHCPVGLDLPDEA